MGWFARRLSYFGTPSTHTKGLSCAINNLHTQLIMLSLYIRIIFFQVLTRDGDKFEVPHRMVERRKHLVNRSPKVIKNRTGSMCSLSASGSKSEFCTPLSKEIKRQQKNATARHRSTSDTPQQTKVIYLFYHNPFIIFTLLLMLIACFTVCYVFYFYFVFPSM